MVSRRDLAGMQAAFWVLMGGGPTLTAACDAVGVNRQTGRCWRLATGGRIPRKRPEPSGRYLSLDERLQIADLRLSGASVRSIALGIGRSASTVSRELRRNGSARGAYAPHAAQQRAGFRGRRPNAGKFDHPELASLVQAKLCMKWSPEQISLHLGEAFPARSRIRVSHETIYQALFVQGRGRLGAGLHRHLRTGRAVRRPRGSTGKRPSKFPDMILISERPSEVTGRTVPGHWEPTCPSMPGTVCWKLQPN
jgi:IS30 family transposase